MTPDFLCYMYVCRCSLPSALSVCPCCLLSAASVCPRCMLRAVSVCQAKKALKNILQKCVHLPALEPLLHDAPPNILKHVVGQFSKVRPRSRPRCACAALKRLSRRNAEPGQGRGGGGQPTDMHSTSTLLHVRNSIFNLQCLRCVESKRCEQR